MFMDHLTRTLYRYKIFEDETFQRMVHQTRAHKWYSFQPKYILAVTQTIS